MPIPGHALPIELGLIHSLHGDEVPMAERRYLLIPISGCADVDPYSDEALSLKPLPLSEFNEDMGWHTGTIDALAHLELGESICSTDGIAQEQVIVRTV